MTIGLALYLVVTALFGFVLGAYITYTHMKQRIDDINFKHRMDELEKDPRDNRVTIALMRAIRDSRD